MSSEDYHKPIDANNYGVELSFEKELQEAIKRARSENKPIILLGPRFSGKTTALKRAIFKGIINKDQAHIIEIPKGQIIDENKRKELKESIKKLLNSGRLVIIEGTEYEIEYILSDENYKTDIDYIKVEASIKKEEAAKIYKYYVKEYLKKLGNKTIVSEEELIKKGKHFLEMAYYEKEGLFMSRYLTWLIERHSDKDEKTLKLIKKGEREKETIIFGSLGVVGILTNTQNLLEYVATFLSRRLQYIFSLTLNPIGIGLGLYSLISAFYGRDKDEGMAKLMEVFRVWNEIHPEKREALCYKLDKENKLPPGTSYAFLSMWLSKDNIEKLKEVLDDEFLGKLKESIDATPALKLAIKEQQRRIEDHEVRFKKIDEKIKKILKKMKELEKKQYTTGATRIKSEKELTEKFQNTSGISKNQKTIVGLGDCDPDRKIKEKVEDIIKSASDNLVLITGEPGVGKSTMLFLVGNTLLNQQNKKVFYITDLNIFNFVGFSEFLKDSYAIFDVDRREVAEKIAERLNGLANNPHLSRIIIAVRTAYINDYISKLKEKINIKEFPLNYSHEILKEITIREIKSEIPNVTLTDEEINEIIKKSDGVTLYISTAIRKLKTLMESGKFEKKILDELPEGTEAMILNILKEETGKRELLLLLYYLISHYRNFPEELLLSAELLFEIPFPSYVNKITDEKTLTLHSWYKDITDWIFKGEFNKLGFKEEEAKKFEPEVEKVRAEASKVIRQNLNYFETIKETLNRKDVLRELKNEIANFTRHRNTTVSLIKLNDALMLLLIFDAVGRNLINKSGEYGFDISIERVNSKELDEKSYPLYAKLLGFLLYTYLKDIEEVNIKQRPFYALSVLYISRLLNDKLAKRIEEEFLGEKAPSLTLKDFAKYFPYSQDRPIRYYIPAVVTLLEKIGYFEPQTEFEKGLLSFCKGKFDEAIQLFDNAINSDKNNPEYYFYKGKALTLLKRYDEALPEFEKAIDLDKNNPDYHVEKGIALSFMKRYNEAIEEYDKALELSKEKNPRFHYYKGITLSHLREYDKALEEFDVAIELDEEDPDFHIKRGITHLEKGATLRKLRKLNEATKEFEKAIKAFNKAIELDPINPQAHYKKGLALFDKGEYKKAIEEFKMAIKLKPYDSRYYYKMGAAYRQLGELYNAIKELNKAIELDSNKPGYYLEKSTALNQLAYSKVNKGDSEEAIKYYEESLKEIEEALKYNPKNPRYLFTKGISLKGLGRFEDAIKFVQEALNRKPGDPDYLIVYAALKADLNSPEEGFNKVKEAVETGKTDRVCLCRKIEKELGKNRVEKERNVLSDIKKEICANEGNKNNENE